MKKFESTTQPGLFYWVEQISSPLAVYTCFHAVSQMEGYPVTEAFDDWLMNRSDAEEIAEKLAKGEL
jgi:hypothetical protein